MSWMKSAAKKKPAEKKAPAVKVSYSSCRIYVEGFSMHCPMCRTLVRSGEHHECGTEVNQ